MRMETIRQTINSRKLFWNQNPYCCYNILQQWFITWARIHMCLQLSKIHVLLSVKMVAAEMIS